MVAKSDPTASFFRCTDRERAAFEAGIKLGAIYHQHVGAAINSRSVVALERAIEASTKAQPHVDSVRVRIDRSAIRRAGGPFRYTSLTGSMLDVSVVTRVGRARARGRLRYVARLDYSLMWVSVSG